METDKNKNTDKKDWQKTAQDAKGDLKTGRIPDKHTDAQYRNVSDKNRNDPNPVKGGEPKNQKQDNASATSKHSGENSKEPASRSSTTDSSRSHKNPHDDAPTGGNIR